MRLIPNPRFVVDWVFPWTPLAGRLEKVAKENPYKGDKYRQKSIWLRNLVRSKLGLMKGSGNE